jgi:diguanylate cyclase (GGDEF)-like protein
LPQESQADRRRHFRCSLHLPSEVVVSGFEPHDAYIEDYSSEGVFLALNDKGPLTRPPYTGVPKGSIIHIIAKSEHGPIEFTASVVRTDKRALGAEFREISSEVQARLNKLLKEQAQGKQYKETEERAPEILARVADISQNFLKTPMRAFLEDLSVKIFTRAQNATSNTQEDELITAQTLLDKNRDQVIKLFLATLRHSVTSILKPNEIDQAVEVDHLRLVDHRELDEWLVSSIIAHRANHIYQEVLYGMQQRFSFILGHHLEDSEVPCGPAMLATALQASLAELSLSDDAKKILYDLFRHFISGQLANFYKEINQYLIDQGILPVLSKKAANSGADYHKHIQDEEAQEDLDAADDKKQGANKKQKIEQARQQHANETHKNFEQFKHKAIKALADDNKALHQAVAEPSDPNNSSSNKSYRDYSGLLQGTANKAMHSLRNMFSMMTAAAPDPNLALAGMPATTQQELLESIPDIDPLATTGHHANLRKEIVEAVAHHYGKPSDEVKLSSDDISTVEFVEQFFHALDSHDEISSQTKQLLHYLEIPVVTQILKQQDFLDNDKHPARQFIDKLSHLGRSGVVLSSAQVDVLQEIVKKTAQQAPKNPDAFKNGVVQLDKLAKIQLEQYQKNLQRTLAGIEGQDKLESAKRDFIKILAIKFNQKYVPHIVLSLLDAGWANLAVNRILKKGINNQQSQQCIAVIEQIRTTLTNKAKPEVKVKALLAFIEKGLHEINGETQHNKHYVQLLERCFALKTKAPNQVPRSALLQSSDFKSGMQFAKLINKVPNRKTDEFEEQEVSIQRWISRAKKLKLGDWVISKEAKGQQRELKLVWIGEEFYKYVFINHNGLKVLDLSLDGLSSKLKNGDILIKKGQTSSVINDALDGLVQNVYNKLAHQSTHDQLTGLINRKEFERKVAKRLIPQQIHRGQSLMHIKINDFDIVTKSCSFEISDEMLCELSDLITDNLPRDIICARMGDASFAVFQNGIQSESAYQEAMNLIEKVQAYRFSYQDKIFSVGFAIGLFHYTKASESADVLIRHAAAASDDAYQSGRNRINVFEENALESAQAEKDLRWISQINSSLLDKRITLTGQRIEHVVTDPVTGQKQPEHYEILMSILNDAGKRMSPVEFITAAEKFKRIAEVDRWVIGQIFKWMNANPETVKKMGGCAINVSGFSLNDETFIEFVMEQIANLKVPKEAVCFEVTETAAISNLSEAADFMYEVKDYGCHFSLDDFGSGLSSYQYLKNLPVDFIKIDGAFVKEITDDPRDFAMVKSITELGHYLDKKVIAERVETEEQYNILKEIGVDFVQGWGIAKPIPLSDLIEG